jgi:hypothetical protein
MLRFAKELVARGPWARVDVLDGECLMAAAADRLAAVVTAVVAVRPPIVAIAAVVGSTVVNHRSSHGDRRVGSIAG